MQIAEARARTNAGAVGKNVLVVAGDELNAKQTIGTTGIFKYAVAKPQPVIQRGDHRFEPRELTNFPVLVRSDAVGHLDKSTRAPAEKPLLGG
jgi:hypothetical protein